ncbi:QacE family quaternary ammonium compound efflux SMR transporter [Gordonia sp. TBRC 11910]|uniref:QacE family quaternary ammonium compound efflux SMR transporter n=1 Tax=Gordonia asplenii TaxID=2725283 RepID=A0A848KVE4_9ACTN|nr:SMR family transporter [Gordonia asplenii]NMO02239.1 QacE family quaternary ammonium compound efflux SMR transporter [Gordonia asplenii]
MTWVWLIAAIVAELVATLCLRASDGYRRRRWLIGTIVGYPLAFVLVARALRAGLPIGVAYGIWVAAGVALVAIAAHLIWRDPLTPRMLGGVAVVAAGVILVEMG